MIVRILVVIGIVAGTALMLLAWLIPTWPYDWAPPGSAQKDADLAYFDRICASASIIIVIAAALLNFKLPAGRLRPDQFRDWCGSRDARDRAARSLALQQPAVA